MTGPALAGSLVRALLACGLLSSLVYVVSDVVGALNYPGYDYAAQAISEMSAPGAPTAGLLAPFHRIFSILFVAFAAGVWLVGRWRRPLRWSAAFLVGVAAVGAGLSIFPMTMRGLERTPSDTFHLIFAGATMVFLAGAMLSGAQAFGRRFQLYSAVTVAVMLLFFLLTLIEAPNVAADLPTPFMGLKERVCMAAWLLWVGVFSVRLLRATRTGTRAAGP